MSERVSDRTLNCNIKVYSRSIKRSDVDVGHRPGSSRKNNGNTAKSVFACFLSLTCSRRHCLARCKDVSNSEHKT